MSQGISSPAVNTMATIAASAEATSASRGCAPVIANVHGLHRLQNVISHKTNSDDLQTGDHRGACSGCPTYLGKEKQFLQGLSENLIDRKKEGCPHMGCIWEAHDSVNMQAL